MSRGVGYIAGVSFDDLQAQWAELLEQKVDVILFDRKVLTLPHKPNATDPKDVANNAIWNWSQAMTAGQEIVGNRDRYNFISDLQSGDVLVLSRLDVLFHAYPGAWPELMGAHARGIQLAVLEYGFHSGGEYGEVMIKKMNTMFELGLKVRG